MFTEPRATCPHCGRVMTVPRRWRRQPQRSGKTGTRTREARGESARDRLQQPGFALGQRPAVLACVLVILLLVGGLLVTRVQTRLRPRRERSPVFVAQDELNVLRLALEQFRRDCGGYPAADPGLQALIRDPGIPGWRGPYVNRIKPDPWRQTYRYGPETEPLVFSYGPDRSPGTADDLFPDDLAELAAEE